MHFLLTHQREVLTLTIEHLWLVSVSMLIAVGIGAPLGILLTRRPKLKAFVLGSTSIIQTIPSLALFGLLLPLPWLGARADRLAIVALALYALLPIVRNTHAGLEGVGKGMRQAALALGLGRRDRLWRIEIPLAMPSILAGIKTSAVINVGTATIAAFVGAGGYGERIVSGLALNDSATMLAGAVPAAMLALIVQGLFELGERRMRWRQASPEV